MEQRKWSSLGVLMNLEGSHTWIGKAGRLSEKGVFSIAKAIHWVAAAVLVFMMLMTATDVCMRYIFGNPITGAYEIMEFMMAVLGAFGFAYTGIKNEHISVEILVSRFSSKIQFVIKSITRIFSLGIFSLITWQSVVHAEKLRLGGNASESLLIPIFPFVYVVAFGSAVFCLVLLLDTVHDLRQVTQGTRWEVRLPSLITIALVVVIFAAPVFKGLIPWRLAPFDAGLFGIFLLLVLLFSGLPIGMCMGLVGFLGLAYVVGLKPGLGVMGTVPHNTVSSYSLSVVPLFILMGTLCYQSGLTEEIYYAVHKWVGSFRGGLAMATVGACALFAAVSGSSLATTATMGRVALPEMKKFKYSAHLASGCIAAGGSIGILIPPSIILVIYAILTEQSIGKLFLAGFIPGVLEAVFYIATIYILCRHNPLMGPKGPRSTFKEKMVALKAAWGVVVLFLLVIGGIYLGVFTPTEAAGVGAFGAFLFSLFKGKLNWEGFTAGLDETIRTTAMMFVILIGAMILGYFFAITRLPFKLSEFVGGLAVNRYIILLLIIALYLVLGAIFSSLAMIVLTVPILFPIITALKFDPIWFGVIIVRVVEMGMITPPVGINVFVLKGVARDLPLEVIFKGITPFLVADICHVALLVAVPQLATFLPSLMS